MASALKFRLNGAEYEAVPVKLERKKLYGWTDLVATDASGEVCRKAQLDPDGELLIPPGAVKIGILDEDGYTGDCALLISSKATPEEVAVFQADSVFSTEDLTEFAAQRLDRQKESYADYAPAEMPKLESAVVRTIGDFVIVCVCADNAKAETLLDSYA